MQKLWVLLVRATAEDILLIIVKSFIIGFALLGNTSLGQINLKLLLHATLFGGAAVLICTGSRISDLPVVVRLDFFFTVSTFPMSRKLFLCSYFV